MSQDTYALRQLKAFILRRIKQHDEWVPLGGMSDANIEDCLFALKIRKDESRAVVLEINRMLNFKPSGRPKKMTKEAKGDE